MYHNVMKKIEFSQNNSKFGMNDPHTPLSIFCEFQLNQTNRKGDVPYLIANPVDIHVSLYTRYYL